MQNEREPIGIGEVCKLVGANRTTLYAWMRQGIFQRPAKFGGHSRWDRREVQAWIDARFAERPDAEAA